MDSSNNRDVSKVLQHNRAAVSGNTEAHIMTQNRHQLLTFNPVLCVLKLTSVCVCVCVCVSDLPAASHVPHCVSSSSQDQQRDLKTLHKLHTLTGRHQNGIIIIIINIIIVVIFTLC